MASKPVNSDNLNQWRDYFRTSNSDIFDIIEQAIMVAALDCPMEFRIRRGRIAEVLFSCKLLSCFGCDRVELNVGKVNVNEGDYDYDYDYEGGNEGFKIKERGFDDNGGVRSKGSNVNSISRDDNGDVGKEMNVSMINVPKSNFSYGDAEALTDEIEARGGIVGEVLRIKEILQNCQDESDSVLFDSLRRLQLMALTYDILKTTEIGKAVNCIRRHSSKQIRHLARSLIDGWKVVVNEWVEAMQELAEEGTPESVNPSTVEEGLPSPPLDEGAFLAAQTMELSQFFEGIDDDGNPPNCGEFNKNREVGRKPSVVNQATTLPKDNKVQQMKRHEPITKPNRPSNMQSGHGRPLKLNGELKGLKDSKVQQKLEKPVIHRRPAPPAEYQKLSSNEDAVQEKLEATKRKLQERYLQAENAKRQRTIQVMELHDLPKQGAVNKNTQGKFGNHSRHWAKGRR